LTPFNRSACKVSETDWRRRYQEEDEAVEMEQRKNKTEPSKTERLV